MERAWHMLAHEFARKGHYITVISRDWTGWPEKETIDGVHYRRIPGFEHTRHMLQHVIRDSIWSIRAYFALPEADVTIANCLVLPIIIGLFRRKTGSLVVMPDKVPKGRFRFYRGLDCVLATSSNVCDKIIKENKKLRDKVHIVGQPIDWKKIASPRPKVAHDHPIVISYFGRIHREKGLDLLLDSVEILAKSRKLPAWHLLICGPRDIAHGGSGETYAATLERRLSRILPPDQYSFKQMVSSQEKRISIFRSIDIFCYPSLSTNGEIFGLPVAEAMAAGAVPVVSQLPCFEDYIHSGESGVIFNHCAPDAANHLAVAIESLLLDPQKRFRLSENARAAVYRYDYPLFSSRLLANFATVAIDNS
jgi:glycosyltransferase involved in cell wall biosynthesis